MEPLLLLPIFISFFIVFLVLPTWIKRARKAGLEGKDMNKYKKIMVAEGGGITVILGFILGILIYVAIITFIVAAGVVLSTLFVKQHYILDEIAGIVLAYVVGRYTFNYLWKNFEEKIPPTE